MADITDAERLDFMLAADSFVHRKRNPETERICHQVLNQDEDERFWCLSGLLCFFPTPRAAIDAAILRKRAGQEPEEWT